MTDCIIYARFSSDEQNPLSARDQADLCAAHAAKEGWRVRKIFTDDAISGARRDRAGFDDMVQYITATGWQNGGFIVLAESLSRFARDLETTARLKRIVEGQNGRIYTLSEQSVSLMHIGLKGTMNELFLEDLRAMTRRGLNANFDARKSIGGAVYGYTIDAGAPFGRRINEDQAEVIRDIFARYIEGESPLAIARDLNAAETPSPSGKLWRNTTIVGDSKRGTGILANPLYAGEIIYGRQRNVKDPETGRTIKRLNPPHLWKRQPAPDLAIIDQATWAKARKLRESRRSHTQKMLIQQRRPQSILSGRIVCHHCGQHFIKSGQNYLCCSSHKAGRPCDSNGWSARLADVQSALIDIIRFDLLAPSVIRSFQMAERDGSRADQLADQKARIEQELAALDGAIENLLNALESGNAANAPAALVSRLTDQEARRAQLRDELRALQAQSDHQNVTQGPAYASQISKMMIDEFSMMLTGKPSASDQAIFSAVISEIELRSPENFNPRSRKQRPPGELRVSGGISSAALAAMAPSSPLLLVPPPWFEQGTSRSTI